MLKIIGVFFILCGYQIVYAANAPNVSARIEFYSKQFLGKPFKLYPTGEGKMGKFDQNPLYRTDEFDCFSYVTYVLACAETKNPANFERNYLKINYLNSKIAFENRFHFANDWNIANAKNGYLVDVTYKIANKKGEKIYRVSNTFIDKPNWFKHLSVDRIYLIKRDDAQQYNVLLAELHNLSKKVQSEVSVIKYIPLTALFNSAGQPDEYIFNQIPSGAIIEIVRSNWDLTKTIGTKVDVSHIGFAIRTKQGLIFREASDSEKWGKGVTDVPLIAYLQDCQNIKSISGINIEMPK